MLKEHERVDAIERALRDAYELGYSAGVKDQRNRNACAYNPSIVWALAQNLCTKLLGR